MVKILRLCEDPFWDLIAPCEEIPVVPTTPQEIDEIVAQYWATLSPTVAVLIPSDGGLGEQLSRMMGEVPFCEVCGHITVRNGEIFRCLNCGNTIDSSQSL